MRKVRAAVVIGANWGDEGKGLVTDALADRYGGPDCVVVRFNGGANAGHTVTTPDGKRHVFSHFGAGTFTGAWTYLSRWFVINPLLYAKERAEFGQISPNVWVSPRARVTTPFDMMLNRFLEEARGMMRHGSVGVGLNETVTRNGNAYYQFDAALIGATRRTIRSKLEIIRDLYVPARAEMLGLELSAAQREFIADDGEIERFIDACHLMADTTIPAQFLPDRRKAIVMEGAQGLLLDERHAFFPYVTRSRTGLTNPRLFATEAGITNLDVYYVTRSYMTRHGEGPFPSHRRAMRLIDETNQKNPWQGSMRFGALDLDIMRKAIAADLSLARDIAAPHLVMTWMDREENNEVILDGASMFPDTDGTLTLAAKALGFNSAIGSYGKTRVDFDKALTPERAAT